MARLTYQDVAAALNQAGARWEAGDTPVSRLDEDAQKALLGAVPSPEVERLMASGRPQVPPATFSPEVDWRNKNGNHVSAITNQGGCGSCVSFGCIAVMESTGHIEHSRWEDLSEADCHFCSSHGPNCSGWWPDQCIDQLIARGACDAKCFSYATAFPNGDIWAGNPKCLPCKDRDARAVKARARQTLPSDTAAKNYISGTGTLAGCIDVYQDFFSYRSGVYHHVTGSLAGGHCIEVIGYSEREQCWIIKNSWDVTWGMNGFGNIAYTDFRFNGQFYPMYGIQGIRFPRLDVTRAIG
jgi:C1A family cysteine protease